ncbi:hypothetical protein BGZ80_001444, partial [Entomortierella chlamydospora]
RKSSDVPPDDANSCDGAIHGRACGLRSVSIKSKPDWLYGGLRPNGPPSPVMSTVFSEPFTIYSAKRFPGMTESTALSKRFAKQGIKIPIRKEPRISRKKLTEKASGSASGDRDQGSDSEDDDD